MKFCLHPAKFSIDIRNSHVWQELYFELLFPWWRSSCLPLWYGDVLRVGLIASSPKTSPPKDTKWPEVSGSPVFTKTVIDGFRFFLRHRIFSKPLVFRETFYAQKGCLIFADAPSNWNTYIYHKSIGNGAYGVEGILYCEIYIYMCILYKDI